MAAAQERAPAVDRGSEVIKPAGCDDEAHQFGTDDGTPKDLADLLSLLRAANGHQMTVTGAAQPAEVRAEMRNTRLAMLREEREQRLAHRAADGDLIFTATVAAASGLDDGADDAAWRLERSLRIELANRAAQDGAWCGDCGRDLASDEPVFKVTLAFGSHPWGGPCFRVAPVCGDCRPSDRWFQRAKPCLGCGRPVAMTQGLAHPLCSKRCRWAWWGRRRRADAPRSAGVTATCACGEPVDRMRSDARYCSNACRQRAWRERKVTS